MTERMALCHGAHSRGRQTLHNNRVALSTTFRRSGVNPRSARRRRVLPQMKGSGMVRSLRAKMNLASAQ